MSDPQVSAPSLVVQNLVRRYGLRSIIRNVSMEVTAGDVVAITGRNGSGKSTLVRMLADVLSPTEGRIVWRLGQTDLGRDRLRQHVGFVAPYLQLYTEFTAWEHVVMVQAMRGLPFNRRRTDRLFEVMNLTDRRDDFLSDYSSGMLQRVRYICALTHAPAFLFLDEPTTNLDVRGIEAVQELIRSEVAARVTVIATNEIEDLAVCNKRLELEM